MRQLRARAKAKAKGAAKKASKKRSKHKRTTCAACRSCAALYEQIKKEQDGMKNNLTPAQQQDVDAFKAHYEANQAHYQSLADATDRPPELIAAIHWRESHGNFDTYLHNGQPLGQKTTIAPKGKDFKHGEFDKASEDAMKMHAYCAKSMKMNKDTKDRAMMDAYAETYNGLGYRMNGQSSAYVYSGTSMYGGGVFSSDGNMSSRADGSVGVDPLIQSIQ